MPISYQPAQAFDSSISEAYGSALAREKNNQVQLQARGQDMQMQEANQRAQLQREAMAQADSHFYSQQGAQAQTATAEMQSRQNNLSQQEDAQARLSQTQLSQAEDIRRQRLERQVNYVQEQAASGALSPQEATDYTMQLRTGLDPLHQRMQRAQTLNTEVQNKILMQQEAMAVTRARLSNRYAAADGPIFHTDEVSGQRFYQDTPGGNWQPIQSPKPEASGAPTPQIMARFATTARSEQAREEQSAARAGQPAPTWAATPQARDADRQRRVNEMVRDHGGSGGATRGDAAGQEAALNGLASGLLGRIFPNVTPAQQPANPGAYSAPAPGTEGDPSSPFQSQ